MEITYEWVIERMNTQLAVDNLTNVVVSVDWKLQAFTEQDDKPYSTAISGNVGMALPGENFTPYEELTKEQVLEWVWSRGIQKQEAESYVASQLQIQIAPPIQVLPNPWE